MFCIRMFFIALYVINITANLAALSWAFDLLGGACHCDHRLFGEREDDLAEPQLGQGA